MTANDRWNNWQPPAGFTLVESALDGVEVYAPEPEAPEPERHTFKCPSCGATTAYSATQASVVCAHCGYTETPDAPVVGRQADEAEFTVQTMEQAARGWGEARREIHCDACGADLSLDTGTLATVCPFCASNRIIARQETHADMLRPGYLIPFRVDRDTCARAVREWLAQGWMHPPQLRRVVGAAQLSGVYLPFWTFGARLETAWQAEVGKKRTRTTWDGKRKTEIKWVKKSGRFDLPVKDLLVPGSNQVNQRLLVRLYPFDLDQLTVYDPAYLAGWQAQVYNVKLRPAWARARAWMRESAKRAAYAKINARRVRNFGMTADLEDERWRYVLLPVYLAAYRFQGKTYQVMVNGQTGQIAGQKPVAWLRVWAVVGLLLAPGFFLGALFWLLGGDPAWQGVAGASLCLALPALVVGLVLALRIIQRAQGADDA